MIITIKPPPGLEVGDIQVSVKLPPEMALTLFVGYLVTTQKVPDEIQQALDEVKKEDDPYGWSMFIEAWQNRSDDAVQDVYEILGQFLKDAIKTS